MGWRREVGGRKVGGGGRGGGWKQAGGGQRVRGVRVEVTGEWAKEGGDGGGGQCVLAH